MCFTCASTVFGPASVEVEVEEERPQIHALPTLTLAELVAEERQRDKAA